MLINRIVCDKQRNFIVNIDCLKNTCVMGNGEKYDIHSKCYNLLSWSNGGKPLPSFQD